MKKLLILTMALTSVSMVSCGDDKEEEEEEVTACSCAKLMDKLEAEMKETEDFKEIQKKYASDIRECDKIQDEMGMEKFMEEMKNCK